MLKTLLKHEIQNLLKSRRIYWTVVMFLLLFGIVFIIRVIDYQRQVNQYIADVHFNEGQLQNAQNHSYINPRAIQQPIIFSIYNQGFKIARVINIRFFAPITQTISLNEQNNKFYNENTQLDITFLVTFFLSLFILLISYDSVNGEKRVGTLRIMMTYPLKKQSFILKKILGIFIFVAFTFTLPYFLSLVSLMLIYANLLTINFFLSSFFYWFLVILFIFFFSLLGVFLSTCTSNPNRSLVYSLLVWILMSIILPISWEYIISPKLYNDRLNFLNQVYRDKHLQAYRIMYEDVPDDARASGAYMYHNGGTLHDISIWSTPDTYEKHYRFQRYAYEKYFPASRETEQAVDDIYRKNISIENIKNWVFFFNPIVLFNNLSMKITGNSREDHLKFLQDSRGVRDELVVLGEREGWLFDYRFFAMYADDSNLSDFWEVWEALDGDMDGLMAWHDEIVSTAEEYEMVLPVFRKYQQPIYTFGEIFSRISMYLVLFVVSILVLWLLIWQKFLNYDVR